MHNSPRQTLWGVNEAQLGHCLHRGLFHPQLPERLHLLSQALTHLLNLVLYVVPCALLCVMLRVLLKWQTMEQRRNHLRDVLQNQNICTSESISLKSASNQTISLHGIFNITKQNKTKNKKNNKD
jgi:hypothetical protein